MPESDIRQRKVRLGDLLIQAGLLSDAQLQLALQDQKRTGSKLGRTVVDMGFVDEVRLLTALSEQMKIPFIDLKHFKFDQELVQRLVAPIGPVKAPPGLGEEEAGHEKRVVPKSPSFIRSLTTC